MSERALLSDGRRTVNGESDGTASRPHRLALICDLAEEEWPSMDLVGEMLYQNLRAFHSTEFATTQVQPRMQRRWSNLPLIGRTRLAHNTDRLLNRMGDYPRYLRTRMNQFDVFHIVDHSYSHLALTLGPARTVITCHDLNTFRCLLEPENEPRPRWFQAVTRRILKGMTSCAHVVCVSEVVRQEILRHRLVPDARLSVVQNAAHPSCCPLPDPDADAIAAGLLAADPGRQTSYLLHVGSTAARKRIDLVLEIFAAVRNEAPGARLVRVGGPFTAAQSLLAEKLGVAGAIQVLPFLDRSVLAAVYRRASILLQPSDAEGFGLPVLEALACGCPVIASDLPVLCEVGGTAAIYCPVGDIPAWTRAAVELLREQAFGAQFFAQRRERACEQASFFSWAEASRKLAGVYRHVLIP